MRKIFDGYDFQGNTLQGIATATAPTQPVPYSQVLALFAGRDFKESVRAASTGNVTLATPGASLDGVNLNNGDRILLKNQTDPTQNGVYVWGGSAVALVRAADFVQGVVSANASMFVEEGSTLADTEWTLTTNNPVTIGTSSLTFVQTAGPGSGAGSSYTAGEGIDTTKFASNIIAVDRTKVAEFFSQTFGDGSATTFNFNHKLGNAFPLVQAILLSDGSTIDVGVTRTDANNISVTTSGSVVLPANGARIMIVG